MITRVKNKLFTNKDTLGYYAGLTFDAFDVTPDGKETMQTLSPRIHFFDEGTGQPVLMLHGALPRKQGLSRAEFPCNNARPFRARIL